MSLPVLAAALLPLQEPSQRVPVVAERPRVERDAPVDGTELRLHDIGELTGARRLADLIRGLVPTSDPVALEGALARLERLARRRAEVRATAESLVAAIRELVDPPLAPDVQRVDLVDDGRLVLVGTAAQHAWLERFLAAAAGFEGAIDLQARVFVLEKGQLASLSRARSGQVLGTTEAAELLSALESSSVEAVVAPRIATFPFQEATLEILDQRAYVKDYEIKILADQDAEIADPVIDVVQSGLEMRLRGIPLPADELGIFATLEYSTLEEPIPSVETRIGAGGHLVTIQLPQVTKVKLEGRFEVRPGQTLLLATVDSSGEKEVLALLEAGRLPDVEPADGDR